MRTLGLERPAMAACLRVLALAALLGVCALSVHSRAAPIPEHDFMPGGWMDYMPLEDDVVLDTETGVRAAQFEDGPRAE